MGWVAGKRACPFMAARTGPKDTAKAAAARAAVLRKSVGGAKPAKRAQPTPDVDGQVPPEGGGTQVMPADDEEKPKAVKKAPAKSSVKVREPALPGMSN